MKRNKESKGGKIASLQAELQRREASEKESREILEGAKEAKNIAVGRLDSTNEALPYTETFDEADAALSEIEEREKEIRAWELVINHWQKEVQRRYEELESTRGAIAQSERRIERLKIDIEVFERDLAMYSPERREQLSPAYRTDLKEIEKQRAQARVELAELTGAE